MKWSLKCGSVLAACLALALIIGGCPSVPQPPGRSSYASAPEFSPPGGYFAMPVNVEIASATEGATIYYTTDQTVPSDTHGQQYTGSVRVDHSMSIKAIAYASGVSPSLTIEAVYTISGNQPPVVTEASVVGNLTPGKIGFVTVSCKVSDPDGYVKSVVADLSTLGATPSQPLARQSDGSWSWQNKVQPMTAGEHDVTLTVTDNEGAITTAKAVIDIQVKPGQQQWAYMTQGAVRSSPAVADDGTVYIGSSDRNLYAFHSDGTLKWKFWTGAPVVSAPAVSTDGTVYVAGGSSMFAVKPDGSAKWSYAASGPIYSSAAIGPRNVTYFGSSDGHLYAVDAGGKMKWAVDGLGSVESSPVIDGDGTIYVGSSDGTVRAVYPNGVAKWSYKTGGAVSSSPAIDESGIVYVGSADTKLYALRPDGTLKWQSYMASSISSPVVGGNGMIYVGTSSGSLCAIQQATGAPTWSYGTGQAISSSAAVASDGTIYFGSGDHNLYALSQEGKLVWTFEAGQGFGSSPLVGPDGTVYVGADDQQVYAIKGAVGVADSSWPVGRGNLRRSGAVPGLPQDDLPPVFSAATIGSNPVAIIGRPATISIDCHVQDFDGTVQSVVADLSEVGGSDAQPLTSAAAGDYQWSDVLRPSAYGSRTIKITATDDAGASKVANVTLKVLSPPAVSNMAVSRPIVRNQTAQVTVSCLASDPDGTVKSVVADLRAIGGGDAEVLTNQGQNSIWSWTRQVAPPGTGPTEIVFTVTDADGLTNVGTLSFHFTSTTLQIYDAAAMGNLTASLAGTLNVSCVPSASDGTVAGVVVDLTAFGITGPQPLHDLGNGTWGASFTVTPPSSGVLTVGFEATDSNGNVADASATVSVNSKPNWVYDSKLQAESSPAVLPDGTVYIGLYSPTSSGLVAINPNGTLKWQYATAGQIQSSPAVGSDGTIYIGCDDRYLHAVTPSGTRKWVRATGGEVNSSPAIGPDGTVYVGSDDGKVYALNPASGALVWPSAFVTGGKVTSSPAISDDGVLYVGSWDKNLYAINTVGGTLKWKHPVTGWIHAAPAIAGNVIYVSDLSGYLYSIDRVTGNENWNRRLDGYLFSSPTVAVDGTIYVGADDGCLYAVNPADGSQKWAFDTGGAVRSTPAVASDGTIYVGSNNNALFAVNADGSQKWAMAMGDVVRSSPAIGADGTVYVASFDGKVYAIAGSSGLANSPWPMFHRGAIHTGMVGGN